MNYIADFLFWGHLPYLSAVMIPIFFLGVEIHVCQLCLCNILCKGILEQVTKPNND